MKNQFQEFNKDAKVFCVGEGLGHDMFLIDNFEFILKNLKNKSIIYFDKSVLYTLMD